ncbi:RHS repeat-associated core domain-containing protein [Kitasatospora sp. NPDC051853]|uniref:RHS repeat-associated core domain-containing protein n=1 Tax=Kitasatospora sp. NPDC051853 TaxID=3364058 RepID=UPI003797A8B7
MSGEFRHDPDAIDNLAKKFGRHADDLDDSHRRHHSRARSAFGRTKGKGGLAAAAEQGIGKLLDSMEQGQKALRKHLADMGRGLEQTSRNHKANEQRILDDLKKFGAKGGDTPKSPGRGGPRPGGRNGPRPDRKGRDQVKSPRESGRKEDSICGGGEPVDMATGRMYIDQVDVALPGSLPLLYTRTFESGYLAGRWMGPRWVCPFDERLEIDEEGVVYLAADRSAQAYPHPEPDEPSQASAGTRWDLAVDPAAGGYTLTDVSQGLVREFTTTPDGHEALLTRVRDRFGRHYDLAYAEDGTPLSLTHSGGYRLLTTVDTGRITALRLADAAEDGGDVLLTRYGYTDGHLTSVYNSSGKPMRFTNDATGRITSWTDRNDSRYLYTYDPLDRVVDEGGADGTLRFHFDYGDPDPTTGIKVHSETNALGHTTRYHINEHAQVTAQVDPLGHTTHFERDEYDRLLAETDPLGRTTRYAYDGAGDLVAVIRPDGERATATYHGESSQPASVTEAGGATWVHTYDESGRRTSLTDPLGAVTSYGYDELGHLASVTDAMGHTTSVRCDAAGLPVRVDDATGAVILYARDAFGRVVAATDALGAVTRMTWTTEGYPATRISPDGGAESWTYDPEGNLVSYTDELGRIATFEYTHFETLAARTGPQGNRMSFTHDADMQLTAVTNALGMQWTYSYDAAGRLSRETDFQGRTRVYQFDAAGQIESIVNDLGQVTRFTHDLLGHPVVKEADGRVTTYGYNTTGHLVRATNADADVIREVDPLGNLLSESVNGRTVTHSLDVLGRRTGRAMPSGHTSHWTYDPAGRPTALATGHGRVTFTYDLAGREQRRTIGDHLTLTSSWDVRHRLVGQSVRGRTGELQRRAYRYQLDGALVGVDDRLTGSRSFELDADGRVTAVQAVSWTERYAYDQAGNLTDADWPATSTSEAALGTRSYHGTQLAAAGRVRYEYDAVGRTTLRQVTRLSRKPDSWHYVWDGEDHLTQVTTPDGTRWQYLYDPFARRIAKLRLGAEGDTVEERTDFTWDGHTLAEQTTHAPYLPGPHTLTWDHHGIEPISQSESIVRPATADTPQAQVDRRFFAIVTDLVGTPVELVDPLTDAIAWRATPTLWGQTTWPADSSTYTPLRFPGQYFDPETRLHYNVNRYYDPETARYTSPDPLGLAPAPNPDSYVSNPHTWTDPFGLSPHKKGKDKPHVSPVAPDWATKGAHIHVGQDEVRVYMEDGVLKGEGIRLSHGMASPKSVKTAVDLVNSDPKLAADLLAKAKSAQEHMKNGNNWGNKHNRADEMQELIDYLESIIP